MSAITTWPGGNAGVSVEGANVLVSPAGSGTPQRAVEVAQSILDAEAVTAPLRAKVAALEARVEAQAETINDLRGEIALLESAREAALTGRRRFFTEVLMAPREPGNWSGEVFLLDPVKKWRGQALSFASVDDVRRHHPELWVIGVTEDGVLLDAWGKKS